MAIVILHLLDIIMGPKIWRSELLDPLIDYRDRATVNDLPIGGVKRWKITKNI